ncbi:MAG: OmpA family protein [Myxococcales bacterium]|nr:OmpA family protein [Myxococcales bacterium]
MGRLRFSCVRAGLVPAAFLATLLASERAGAQQPTFHLDRLQVPGAPDDGVVMFRPVTQPKPTAFAQLALGYSKNPLKASNITRDRSTLAVSETGVVNYQLTTYATIGLEFLNRFVVSASLPVTIVQGGQNPNYVGTVFGSPSATRVIADGGHLNDMRLDFRAVLARTASEKGAVGARLALLPPSGSNSNFGGDGSTSGMLMIDAEYDLNWIVVTGNTGFHFRPRNSINDPNNENGLGVGNEWRWAVGGFIPFKAGRYRIGASLFGQTGIESDAIIGETTFKKRNTPLEWNAEGRMRFGPEERFWAGASAGTLISNGYGAPDLRILGLFGVYTTLFDVDVKGPGQKNALRAKWRSEKSADSDKDGIPDDIDACPSEPEDHEGSDPNDGCPMPPDRDGDGIPDQYDKCPDQPEDKDGIEDGDGCPEDDFDKDGVPDATDACPKEPGQPSKDPKRNGCPQFIKLDGGGVEILQQVHFQTGSATILPDSFPMLQEIASLLKANASIKKMQVEGHTDDRGDDNMNLKLSQSRSESVVKYLAQAGVDQARLSAQGFGETKPIEDNKTDKGRAANRRVEFKITEQEDANAIKK